MDPTASAPGEHRLPLRFVGSGSEYFRIWVTNLLLVVLTLGLYYPYAKARRMRYFHSVTEIDGEPLAFHGDPSRMLRGYLLVGVMATAYAGAGQVSALAALIAFVVLALLWPTLWHSALRFRLANTSWRGLRLRFTGSTAGAYVALAPCMFFAGLVPLVGLLTADAVETRAVEHGWLVFTAGLLLLLALPLSPWLFWRLRRYQHDHYALADQVSRFKVPAGAFYGLALRTTGVTLLTTIPMGMAVGLAMAALAATGTRPGTTAGPAADSALVSIVGMLISFLFMQVGARPYFTSRLQNLCWGGTSSGQVRFESRLRYGPLLRLSAKNWLLVVLTLGLYQPFAAIAMARLRLEAIEVYSLVDPADLHAAGAGSGDAATAGDAAGDLFGLDLGL